ncbi:MAG: ATP-binding protein [Solirubrobacteraceae bacterium]
MRRRLIASTGMIALAAVLILGLPLGIVETKRTRSDAAARLEREADAVAAAVDDRVEAHKPITAALITRYVHHGHTVVVVTPDGRRTVAGSPLGGDVLTQRSGAAQRAHITAAEPRAEVTRRVNNVWLLIGALGAGGVIAATGLAAVQARRLVHPLDTMAGTSRRLGQGDFSARAGRFGIPEIDVVAEALDVSAERIAEMVAREREFSGNVSHQLRTPLTALRLRLEEVAELDDGPARRAEAELALAEADRLDATIEALLQHARSPRDQRVTDLDLDRVVGEHVQRWRRVYRDAGRPLVVQLDLAGRRARSSAAAAGQVLDVLLENALRHGRGEVRVATYATDGRACVTVEDEGPGIPPGAGDIFERGTSNLEGSGIGLHLARALASAHAGQLFLAQSAPPRFELRLRMAAPADDGSG